MSETKSKISLMITATLSVVIGAFLIGSIASLFAPEKNDTEKKIEQIRKDVQEIKEEVKNLDYQRKDFMSKVVVVDDLRGQVVEGVDPVVTERTIIVTGKLELGYLYVKASVDNYKLTPYDSIYVRLLSEYRGEYINIGGHLRRDKSLGVPKAENYTELLYKLKEVFYKTSIPYQEGPEVQSADFLSVLNEGSNTKIFSFSSTLRNGFIDELSIYYKCAQEEDCNIRVLD